MSLEAKEALAIALATAEKAAELMRGVRTAGEIRSKSNVRDLVTEWDLRCEELIRAELAQRSPGVAILGEEAGGEAMGREDQRSRQRWLVDPIDGTVNFAHGLPYWAISIALESDNAPLAGVVVAPALGWTFAAHLGGGATCNGEPMSVSAIEELEQSLLVTGFPYDRAASRLNFAQWEHMQCTAGACRRLGAAALDLALVARGSLDGYWEVRLNPWDVGAGALLVTEAGGVVTDITGGPFVAEKGEAIAANSAIHKQIVDELAKVQPPLR